MEKGKIDIATAIVGVIIVILLLWFIKMVMNSG